MKFYYKNWALVCKLFPTHMIALMSLLSNIEKWTEVLPEQSMVLNYRAVTKSSTLAKEMSTNVHKDGRIAELKIAYTGIDCQAITT